MRVLIVDELRERAEILREGLERAGHEVTAHLSSALELMNAVEKSTPDIIIIDTDSPSRDVLEHVVMVSRDRPRPIVMFTEDGDQASIERAFSSGVTTYIVEGLQPARVRSILDVARARFAAEQALRDELEKTRGELAARKTIERAKGLLMESRKLSESDAFALMRKMAMDRQTSLMELAEQIITAKKLLG